MLAPIPSVPRAATVGSGAVISLSLVSIVGADRIAPQNVDKATLKAVARAYTWLEQLQAGRARDLNAIAVREGLAPSYVRDHLPLAFLAPSIVTAILEGRQPKDLSLNQLMCRAELSSNWTAQRHQLGFDR